MLLHVQDPILYVIRKAYRQSKDKGKQQKMLCINVVCVVYLVTPLADYYILGGVVYQCPDLRAVINSRMVCVCVVCIRSMRQHNNW